jgi:hypothetical protein
MTIEQRYFALLTAYRDSKAPPRGTIPTSNRKEANQIRKDLFLFAAQRFLDVTGSAEKWILRTVEDQIMMSAMDKFYGRPRRKTAA